MANTDSPAEIKDEIIEILSSDSENENPGFVHTTNQIQSNSQNSVMESDQTAAGEICSITDILNNWTIVNETCDDPDNFSYKQEPKHIEVADIINPSLYTGTVEKVEGLCNVTSGRKSSQDSIVLEHNVAYNELSANEPCKSKIVVKSENDNIGENVTNEGIHFEGALKEEFCFNIVNDLGDHKPENEFNYKNLENNSIIEHEKDVLVPETTVFKEFPTKEKATGSSLCQANDKVNSGLNLYVDFIFINKCKSVGKYNNLKNSKWITSPSSTAAKNDRTDNLESAFKQVITAPSEEKERQFNSLAQQYQSPIENYKSPDSHSCSDEEPLVKRKASKRIRCKLCKKLVKGKLGLRLHMQVHQEIHLPLSKTTQVEPYDSDDGDVDELPDLSTFNKEQFTMSDVTSAVRVINSKSDQLTSKICSTDQCINELPSCNQQSSVMSSEIERHESRNKTNKVNSTDLTVQKMQNIITCAESSGLREFNCKICQRRFCSLSYLKIHKSKVHFRNKSSTKPAGSLYTLIKKLKKRIKCDVNKPRKRRPKTFRLKIYTCTRCFTSMSGFNKSILLEHWKTCKVSATSKTSLEKQEQQTPQGNEWNVNLEKIYSQACGPFVCFRCGRAFKSKGNIIQHIRFHMKGEQMKKEKLNNCGNEIEVVNNSSNLVPADQQRQNEAVKDNINTNSNNRNSKLLSSIGNELSLKPLKGTLKLKDFSLYMTLYLLLG